MQQPRDTRHSLLWCGYKNVHANTHTHTHNLTGIILQVIGNKTVAGERMRERDADGLKIKILT